VAFVDEVFDLGVESELIAEKLFTTWGDGDLHGGRIAWGSRRSGIK